MNINKPEIILIHPCRFIGQNEERSLEYGQKFMPLGLLSLGTFLKKNNFRVKIIDVPMDKNFQQTIIDNINDELILVGISVMTIHISSALDITKFIKNINKNIPVVWGGIHPTLFPKETCRHPLIDFVIAGDGELPLLELTRSLKNKKEFKHIKGLAYREKGAIVFNKDLYPALDINLFPIFNYDLLEVEKYIYKNIDITGIKGGHIQRVMPVLAGRGCPYKCTFCINTTDRKQYRGKTAERLLEEIHLVIDKYKAEYIHFEDEVFLLNKNRIEKLFDGIEKNNYKFNWLATIRANFYKPELISEELLARMKRNGCLNLCMGIESGSPRMLKIYKKEITVEEAKHAAVLNYKYSFFCNYSFIVGAPTETKEDILQSLRLAKELRKIDPLGFVSFQTFRPQSGCELYEKSLAMGLKVPIALEDWAVASQSSLRGYFSLEYLPWLNKKQAEFYEYLSIFAELSFQNLHRIKKSIRIIAWMARQLFLFRLITNFWGILIEMKLYNFLKQHGLFKHIRKVFFTPKHRI